MRLAALALGFTLTATSAFAQSTNQSMTRGISTEDFVKTVAKSDTFEIAVSKLADMRGTTTQKSFAQQMIHDHTQTSSQLEDLVTGEKIAVPLPTKLDKQQRSQLKTLGWLKGEKFAGRFDAIQIKVHEDAISLFENYVASGDNAKLKDWATKTLPTLKHHLQMAQGLSS